MIRTSLTQPNELAAIIKYATGKAFLIEIGVGFGGTSLEIRRVMSPNGVLTLIDPFIQQTLTFGPESGIRKVKEVFDRVDALHNGRVEWMVQTSEDARKNFSDDIILDFLFIDGDHSEEAVKLDWKLWSPLVVKGGHVLFHDVALWCPGVLKAFSKIDKTGFRVVGSAHGLQVLVRE